MNHSSQPSYPVYRSTIRRRCVERAVVLQSADIDYDIAASAGEFILLAPEEDADRAAAEIEAYERELAETEASDSTTAAAPRLTQDSRGWYGVYAYGCVLILIDSLKLRFAFGIDWVEAGKAGAGQICTGQWWRTVTALTLHADVVHLAANVFFGALFGLYVGQLLGSSLAWASILLAGALGNALNAAIRPPEHSAIGASTAIFGALGLLAAYAWRQRKRFEVGLLRQWTPIIGGVLLLTYTGTGGERTDVLAHVTGFLSGVVLGVIHSFLARRIEFKPKTQATIGMAALIVLAVCWLLAVTHVPHPATT